MYAWIHNIAPSCLRYEIYVHIKKKAWSNHSSQSIDKPKLSHLLLLPGCTAIAGYHTSSDNSNSQQQLMGSYRQKSNSLLAASQPRRVKTTRNGIYLWQFQYDNIIYTIPCTSNGVICGYKKAFVIKELSCHTSCEICRNPLVYYSLVLLVSMHGHLWLCWTWPWHECETYRATLWYMAAFPSNHTLIPMITRDDMKW